ncbi:Hypothetical protein, putative [Bodo saltans]|uniref:Uncharacterized protein n=1 Tax=Bodo saltans TaxID=75058 RepID=A0A0S4J789_BODSA|nr:Hypothetical protein, putative [Bodo saltans]|eukprot:CUG53995.1 Hypothetical protein, putative [Bodo saltans]
MLPIDVSLTKSVLLASRFGCAADMLVIAAGLTLQRSPYRLPMRAFFQSDYEFQENVMLALRSIHHFDQQRCNDLFQYIAILEEALAAGGRLGDFCTRWYLSFRQVQSLLRTTKLLCKRLLTAEQAGKMRFTDADRATMRRLSGEQHHGSSSALRFQSLVHEGCSELLQLALAQDAERMVSASVESLTNSLQRLLDNAKTPDGRPPAWLISPESFHSDVVFFSGVDKTVAGAGSKALADHLKLFDVKDSLVFPVGHGTYGAVVRVPHEKETAERSVPAGGQPHPLSVAARTDAICRMGRLYRSSHWSFCASKEGDMSSSMSLPKAQTTAVVKRWKAVELPSKSMNTAESDDDDDYERDEDDDSTAPYSSDSSASLPAKTSNRAKKGAAKGKQQKKKKKLTAVVTNLQLDRWSAVGSTSTVVLGAGVKSIPAFGFAFNLMSTQASMLLASTVLMINANGGFPLLALLASRRSTQLPPVLQVSVLKPDPFSDNDAPLVKHIATNIPSYDLILESAAAAQSNNSTICATTFLELNLIRMLLCTGVAASPHGDNKQASRASNKHHGGLSHSREEHQVLPTAEAILRTISDIRSLRSSNANGARQFVISSGAPPSKSKWETMWLRVARLEAHPQLALYDIASLVEGSGVFSATTTSNAAAAAPPRTAWQRAIHAYTTCVANTAVSITALAVQHQKKQSLHMKRQTSNEAPQSVAAPPQAVAAKGSQKQRSVVASPAPSAATQSSTAASSAAAAGFVSRILATSVMLEIPFTSATIQSVLSAALSKAHKKEMRQWLLQHPDNNWIAHLIDAKWIVVQQQPSSSNGSCKDLYVPGSTMRCTEFPSVKTAVQLITTSRESELYFSAPKSKKKTARFCMTLLPSPWPKICNDDATRSQVLKSDWMTKVLASLVNSAQWLILLKSRYQLKNVPSAMVKAPPKITTEEKPSVDSGTVIGSDDSDTNASHSMSPPPGEIPPRQQQTIPKGKNVAIEYPTVASTVQLVVASPRSAEYFSKSSSARQAALFYISLLPDPWATLLSRDVPTRNKFAVSAWAEGVRTELLSRSWLVRTSRGYMHAAAAPVVADAAIATPTEESDSTANVSVANNNNNNNTVVTTQTTPAQTQPPSHPLPPHQHIITKILATKVTLEAPFTSSAVRDMLLTSSKLNAKNKKELRLWMMTDPSWLSHLVAANWVTPSGEKKKYNSNSVDSRSFEPGPAMISTPFPTVDKTVQLVINSAQSVTYFEEPKSGRKAAMFCISLLPNPWASMCAKDVATRNLFATSRWIGDVLAELVKSQWLVLAKEGYRHCKTVVHAPTTALASAMIPTPVFSFDDSVPVLPAFHFGNATVASDSLVTEEIARPKDRHTQLRQRITTILLNAKCPLVPPFTEHNDSLVNWISTTIVGALGKQAPPELLLATDKKSQWLAEAAVIEALVDVEWLVCLPTQTASSESSPRMFSAGKRMKQLPTPTVTEMVLHLNVHKGAIHDEVGTLSYFHTPRSKADTARFLIKHLPQPWAQLPATTKAVWQNSAWMATVIAELVKLEWLSQLEGSYTTQ